MTRGHAIFLGILSVFSFMTFGSAETKKVPPGTAACHNELEDPFLWLEEVEGERALDWVRAQNARTQAALEANPVYAQIFQAAKDVLLANDRVPFSSFADGYFWNFWQDETNKHGIFRRTTYQEYLKGNPKWETILDFDKLSVAENENWVYSGRVRLSRTSSRRLLYLSRGGKDAKVVREYDYETKQFIADGFNVATEARHDITPLDENTVLIGSDFGPGSKTVSGYPRIIKLWKRGQPLSEAKTLFEVGESNLSASAYKIEHGDEKHVVFVDAISFFEHEYHLQLEDGQLRKLPLPKTAELKDIRGGQIYIFLKEDLGAFKTGSLVKMPMNADSMANAQLVFHPQAGESIEGIDIAADRVFITLLTNVHSRVLELKQQDGRYISRELPFPPNGNITFSYKDEDDATSFSTMMYSDYLTPQQQYRVHDEDGSYRLELLKTAPSRFDSSKLKVEQYFATSEDGTKIPYSVIMPKDIVYNGKNPTIEYGYGGFEISMTPYYSAIRGKLWLERGGVYVVTNIRGGGEYGPAWHQAALKENRQRAFDDFEAIAEDLIAKGITSPRYLGNNGGSNGGLLTGTVTVQRPDLYNAALIQVPLLDMKRYNKLLAGQSWQGEYGNPDIPEEWAYISKYSPYQNVRADVHYPVPFFTTSTKDDRVHPGHARKMAARMLELGHQVFYYENINGGHAGSANLDETAHMMALEYTYLWQQLKPLPEPEQR